MCSLYLQVSDCFLLLLLLFSYWTHARLVWTWVAPLEDSLHWPEMRFGIAFYCLSSFCFLANCCNHLYQKDLDSKPEFLKIIEVTPFPHAFPYSSSFLFFPCLALENCLLFKPSVSKPTSWYVLWIKRYFQITHFGEIERDQFVCVSCGEGFLRARGEAGIFQWWSGLPVVKLKTPKLSQS